MKRTLLAVFLVATAAFAVTSVSAQNLETIKARKELFKEMGKATKDPGDMLKQAIPFDLAKVKAALAKYQENALKVAKLFPYYSKTVG